MEPDTERLLTPETLEGKESRGGRVELAEAVRDELEGTWALAMLLDARVSICAIACVCKLLQAGGGVLWASWLCRAMFHQPLDSIVVFVIALLYCIVLGGVCCSWSHVSHD